MEHFHKDSYMHHKTKSDKENSFTVIFQHKLFCKLDWFSPAS